MESVAGEPKDEVTRLDATSVDDSFDGHDADHAASEIVGSGSIDARKLRCFSPDERATERATCPCHPPDQSLEYRLLQLSRSEVIQEKEWFGTTCQKIVRAVVNEVDTDPLVVTEDRSDDDLGPDTVDSRDER
jgi:hypothetical protein